MGLKSFIFIHNHNTTSLAQLKNGFEQVLFDGKKNSADWRRERFCQVEH